NYSCSIVYNGRINGLNRRRTARSLFVIVRAEFRPPAGHLAVLYTKSRATLTSGLVLERFSRLVDTARDSVSSMSDRERAGGLRDCSSELRTAGKGNDCVCGNRETGVAQFLQVSSLFLARLE
ncbi:hypothetical protein WH47_08219, partial [Habropoda laboriosa]